MRSLHKIIFEKKFTNKHIDAIINSVTKLDDNIIFSFSGLVDLGRMGYINFPVIMKLKKKLPNSSLYIISIDITLTLIISMLVILLLFILFIFLGIIKYFYFPILFGIIFYLFMKIKIKSDIIHLLNKKSGSR
jgi:hypothetical protein